MIRVKTKKGWKTTQYGREYLEEEEECKETCKIISLVMMTLTFCAIKISLFIMMGKFVFQYEDNLFGFPVRMFSFSKTNWIRQHSEVNSTGEGLNSGKVKSYVNSI